MTFDEDGFYTGERDEPWMEKHKEQQKRRDKRDRDADDGYVEKRQEQERQWSQAMGRRHNPRSRHVISTAETNDILMDIFGSSE